MDSWTVDQLVAFHNKNVDKTKNVQSDEIYRCRAILISKTKSTNWDCGYLDLTTKYDPVTLKKHNIVEPKIIVRMESKEAQKVLQNCTVDGNTVKLPNGQLDRKLYMEVAKALELIGGKWKGGKIAGFVFASDPTELLNEIANGEKRNLKKEFQFFATPDALADELVRLAELKPGDTILEPSAGQGAIIKAINKVCDIVPDCFELMGVNRIVLNKSELRFNLIGEDFFDHRGKGYTKIIANPPFSKNQDIDHLKEMYNCLLPSGRLVCITSESWVNGSQRKQMDFINWLTDLNAEVLDIEKGAFKESGTAVGGKIIVIDR